MFEALTLPMLEVLRFGRGKEVEAHISWFMGRLEVRLDQLPLTDNEEFLRAFCTLYDQVTSLLKDTQNKF